MKSSGEIYEFGDFRMSLGERVLRRGDQIVPLTPKCFDTLLVLVRNSGAVVEKEGLMRAVWPDAFVEEGNLAQNIFTLRKALGEPPDGGQYIQTIPKRGYRLVVPATAAMPAIVDPPAAEPNPATSPPVLSTTYKLSNVVLVGIAVASTLLAARWVLSPVGTVRQGPQFTILTVPNNVAYGVIWPDGKRIAYVSHDPEGQSLWVRATTGIDAGTRLIPPVQGHYWGVSIPLTQDYLYYVFEDETRPAEGVLYRIAATGGEPQKLLTSVSGAPSFSPDGRRMVLKNYDLNGRGTLLMATAAGADVQTIARSDAAYPFYCYHWAEDGKTIEYVEGRRNPNGNVWAMLEIPASGGSATTVIAPQPKPLRSVTWLSGHEWFALVPDPDSGMSQIWRWRGGAPLQRASQDINDYSMMNATANGQTLLVSRQATFDTIWTNSTEQMAEGKPVRLALPAGTYNDPAWTPDGRVVFAAQSGLWLSTTDGKDRRPLLPEKTLASEPAVAGDGSFVVFVLQRQGARNLWRVNIDGTGLRQVTRGRYDWHPVLTPDGKWVLYEELTPGQRATRKVPVDQSAPPVALAGGGETGGEFSPDGRMFAFRSGAGELEIRSFADGSLLRALRTAADPSDIHWSADGKSITYIVHSGSAEQFWKQSVAGGPAVLDGKSLPSDVAAAAWSRDDHRIVYLRREIRVDLSLMTNLR